MFVDPITQWLFTILFGVLAIYSLRRMVGERAVPIVFIGHLLHAAMSAGMAAMAWPWWERVPWLAQVVFFACATLWYLVLCAIAAHAPAARQRCGGGPDHQFMHAVMMGAMAWMVVAMAPGEGASADAGGHAHHLMGTGVSVAGALLTAGLLIAGALTATAAAAGARHMRLPAFEHGATSAMNFGMAAMCALMLAM